ncbi:MAG TPA: ABC transporter permease [Acidimicrobiales bacterium]
MSALSLTWRQFGYEQKLFRRTPAAMFFVIVFPVVLLLIFGSLNRNQRLSQLGGLPFTQYYTPSMAAFGLMSSCYANVAGRFVYRRESGVLKRFRASPLPTGALIGGLLLNAVAVGSAVALVNLTAGHLLYNAVLPHRWAVFALLLVVASASFCEIGVGVSCLVPNQDSSDPIVWGTFMPLVFISGTFFPVPGSSPLSALASIFPIQHLVKATVAVFNPASAVGIPWGHLFVIALWGAAGALLAVKRFRWEPTRK